MTASSDHISGGRTSPQCSSTSSTCVLESGRHSHSKSVETLDPSDPGNDHNATPESRTPLPFFQMSIVCLIMFAEPVTATVIYPFVNQFVQETGVTHGDEKKTGYFAGLIESTFFVGEALTALHWGWASDRFGRRPILLIGPLGLSLAMVGFGLSKGFWALVAYRCLEGVFNGNIGVSKSVMAEVRLGFTTWARTRLTDETNIADAFALISILWSVGMTLGPLIGGLLARPAVRWPDGLGKISLLKEYPYLLPCLVAGLVAFTSYISALCGLRETLPSAIARNARKQEQKRLTPRNVEIDSSTSLITGGDSADYGTASTATHTRDTSTSTVVANTPDEEERPLPFRALMVPRVLIPLTNYIFLAFSEMAGTVLRPLMYSTSIHHGGLGLSPYEIGLIMAVWGIFSIAVQVGLVARLIRRFGPRTVYICAYASSLVSFSAFPIMSLLARRANGLDRWVWIVMVVQLFFTTMNSITYACISVFIVDGSPNKASIGSTNGLAQMVGSTVRSLSPTVVASLFSISLERHLAGGFMVYWVLLGFNMIGIRMSLLLPRQLHGSRRE